MSVKKLNKLGNSESKVNPRLGRKDINTLSVSDNALMGIYYREK